MPKIVDGTNMTGAFVFLVWVTHLINAAQNRKNKKHPRKQVPSHSIIPEPSLVFGQIMWDPAAWNLGRTLINSPDEKHGWWYIDSATHVQWFRVASNNPDWVPMVGCLSSYSHWYLHTYVHIYIYMMVKINITNPARLTIWGCLKLGNPPKKGANHENLNSWCGAKTPGFLLSRGLIFGP